MKTNCTKEIEIGLWNGFELSGIEILRVWRVYRASSVINKLRNRGVPIKTKMVQHPVSGKRYGVYYIDISDRIKDAEKRGEITF